MNISSSVHDHVVLFGAVATFFIAGFLIVKMPHSQSVQPFIINEQTGAQVQEVHWEERITTVGGAPAYEELAKSVVNQVPNVQHEAAHIFGAALYRTKGLSGLSVCDSRFFLGCLHEFMARAIEDHGLSIVQELDQTCVASHSSGESFLCQHGMGHGIEAALGYSLGDLQTALATCKSLANFDPTAGCYSGVFMEYNMRSMLGTSSLREAQNNDMYAPCNALSDPYVLPCAFSQSQWWNELLFSHGIVSDAKRFTAMGLYCEHLGKTSALRRACFGGIGNITAATVQFDPQKSIALCDMTSDIPEERASCINVVASNIGNLISASEGMRACAYLPYNARSTCAEGVRAVPSTVILESMETPSTSFVL